MDEIRVIPGFSKYMVSRGGDVYSYRKSNEGAKLKWILTKVGYYHVKAIDDSGATKSLYVHRAIALAFIPNPENKPNINHKTNIYE